MSGLAYIATGPTGTPWASLRLRIHAQRLENHPDQDRLKTVVQVCENGEVLVEDPIVTYFLTPLELVVWLSDSRRDGWELEAAA